METAQQTQAVRSYDIPAFEGMSAEEAKSARSKVMADAAGDPKHPYTYSFHPQAKGMRAAIKQSYEITASVPKTTQDCNEAVALGEQKKAKDAKALIASAQFEADAYEAAGGEHIEMPKTVLSGQVKCLRILRLGKEGKVAEMVSLLNMSRHELRIDAATEQNITQIAHSECSKELKDKILKDILTEVSVKYREMTKRNEAKVKSIMASSKKKPTSGINSLPNNLRHPSRMTPKEWEELGA